MGANVLYLLRKTKEVTRERGSLVTYIWDKEWFGGERHSEKNTLG
jgi:hypothetical protein